MKARFSRLVQLSGPETERAYSVWGTECVKDLPRVAA